MANTGIDYGLGTTNINPSTGIRNGVISQHSISGDALNDMEPDYGDPHCPKCGNEVADLTDPAAMDTAALRGESVQDWDNYREHGCDEYACAVCEHLLDSQDIWSEEPQGMTYDSNGYTLRDCLDSDIFVIKSDYFTYAQFCSPCVPGACNLDHTMPEGAKCYALGHDWFEGGVAPYPVFRVSDGAQVWAEIEPVGCDQCHGSGRDTVERLAMVRGLSYFKIDEMIVDGRIVVEKYNRELGRFSCCACHGDGYRMLVVESVWEPLEILANAEHWLTSQCRFDDYTGAYIDAVEKIVEARIAVREGLL